MNGSNFENEPIPEIIAEFCKSYKATGDDGKNQSYYSSLADYVRGQCEDFFRVRFDANVTSRAKSPKTLQEKLVKRHPRKKYTTPDSIRDDIPDLAGVRIALFYPNHKSRVNSFIVETFHVDEKIEHPIDKSKVTLEEESHLQDEYNRRFKGYQATHYRIRFKKPPTQFRKKDRIEIQVMSVLQSAWSEVEHNILYKKLGGSPSFPERQMLDGLNGLVSVGELYVEQLSSMHDDRIMSEKGIGEQFPNQYELGTFLICKIRHSRGQEDFDTSSVEVLLKFLKLESVGINSKDMLSSKLSQHKIETNLDTELKTPFSTKPNISIIIMERLLNTKTLTEKAQKFATSSVAERCKVLASTIISLDELFPPVSFWACDELMGWQSSPLSDEDSSRMKALEWLMNGQLPRNMLIGDKVTMTEIDLQRIECLWNWLDMHSSKFVRFVFSLSKLGVVRDFPQDILLLERTYRVMQEYLQDFTLFG
ncbi:uncharacterized protein K452DRAFT_334670 [Aplosporella prunicola CBS 121167]|uniref:RelA/SpoT domain-containing protein n=1 Tax=Aplosporella prunicola CBS 121167 TaxID=1176127 RepID=A0A6A6BA67_9PEZI|nr:uncharacterized protein K452DRAFT_334670 [Aplosporella prunicola CBS 121167]KAF2141142.1 hypothetical protein K452DRAFT_334670 [Aplosporella prunicola CBS 121167]